MNIPFIQCYDYLSIPLFSFQYFANEIFIQMFHYFNFSTFLIETFYLISSPEAYHVAWPIISVTINKGSCKAIIEVRAKKLMFHSDSIDSTLQSMTRTCESLVRVGSRLASSVRVSLHPVDQYYVQWRSMENYFFLLFNYYVSS